MRRDRPYTPTTAENAQLIAADRRANGFEVTFDHAVCETLVDKGYLEPSQKAGSRPGDRDGTVYELTPAGRELHAGRAV